MTTQPPTAQSGLSAAVVFRFRDATIPDHWSRWLPMDDLHHYGKDGSLVSGPHPDWAVEYAYPPAGARDAVTDEMVESALIDSGIAYRNAGLLWIGQRGDTEIDRKQVAGIATALTGKADGEDVTAVSFDAWFASANPYVNSLANENDEDSRALRAAAREGWCAALNRHVKATQPAAPGAVESETDRVRRMVGDPRRGVEVRTMEPNTAAPETTNSTEISSKLVVGNTAATGAGEPCHCARCGPPLSITTARMIVCATCGNKRCPHATDHRYACTGSNEPGQFGSSYGETNTAARHSELDKALTEMLSVETQVHIAVLELLLASRNMETAEINAIEAAIKALAAQPAPVVGGLHLPEDGAYLIRYDDASEGDESFSHAGAREAAFYRYDQRSSNWNAHLYVKIASNSRDCEVPNALLAARPGGEGYELKAYEAWFLGEQLTAYDGMWSFARAAWLARAAHPSTAGGEDPIGWVFQHDETGRTTFCPNDGINNPDSFAANNPRFVLTGPAYAHPAQAGGEDARDAARYRWLRGRAWISSGSYYFSGPPYGGTVTLDLAIDKALSSGAEGAVCRDGRD